MPWSNQGGGGGPWGGGDNGGKKGNGGNNGGPWGQGPKGGGPNGGPPDLEDMLRKGQDQLKQVLPSGAGFNGGLIALLCVGVIVLWFFKAFYTVQPDELGVELLFGKPKNQVEEPGLHFHLWPIEKVEIVNTAEKLIQIGSGNAKDGTGLMLTGDQNIVDVQFSVRYQISNPAAYLFNVASPDLMLRQVAESAVREIVGRRPAQDIFRDNRAAIENDVDAIIQKTMKTYGAGLTVNAVSIEDAAPPREVADAFDEVQRAEQDEDRFIEEANQYYNQKLGQARGHAAQVSEDAAGYKNRIVQEAEGEAQRFLSVYNEYAKAPEVTRRRLFLEAMEQVFKEAKTTIIGEGARGSQGVVPYLPLNEVQKDSQGAK